MDEDDEISHKSRPQPWKPSPDAAANLRRLERALRRPAKSIVVTTAVEIRAKVYRQRKVAHAVKDKATARAEAAAYNRAKYLRRKANGYYLRAH